jgi:Ca2+-binding RTX toxin-like protein
LLGGADNDLIAGGAGRDHLQGNRGADQLSGGLDDDTVRGGADNDTLDGGAGNDLVMGDAGDDQLQGGAGLDRLIGGAGNDRFVFAAGDATIATSGTGAFATDHIADFGDGSDQIHLPFAISAILTGTAASAADAYTNATTLLAGHANMPDVAAIAVGADMILFYHADGGIGAPDSAITLDGRGASTLTTADFI